MQCTFQAMHKKNNNKREEEGNIVQKVQSIYDNSNRSSDIDRKDKHNVKRMVLIDAVKHVAGKCPNNNKIGD